METVLVNSNNIDGFFYLRFRELICEISIVLIDEELSVSGLQMIPRLYTNYFGLQWKT